MTFRILASILIVFISFNFYSCSDSPTSIGSDLLSQDYISVKTIDSNTDSLNQMSGYFKRTLPLATSNRILLGKYSNVESSILMRFYFSFSDSLAQDFINDNVNVTSARVELIKNYLYGNANSYLDYTVHKVNSPWLTGFNADSLAGLNYDAADISSGHSALNDSSYSFALDNQFVQDMLKAAADTNIADENGIFIQPTTNSEKALGFYALSVNSTVGIPELIVVLNKPGVYSADTLVYIPTSDISVVTGSVPNTTDMIIQGGLVINSKLYFDVSSVPQKAVINLAQLTLTADSNQTVGNLPSVIGSYFLNDSTTYAIDTARAVSLTLSNNKYTGDISPFVRDWINKKENQGMLLNNPNELGVLDLTAIKGSNASDPAVRPKLKIVYTIKE